jgi:hypothetical protein
VVQVVTSLSSWVIQKKGCLLCLLYVHMTDKLKKCDRLKKPTTYGGRLVGRRLVGARAHD